MKIDQKHVGQIALLSLLSCSGDVRDPDHITSNQPPENLESLSILPPYGEPTPLELSYGAIERIPRPVFGYYEVIRPDAILCGDFDPKRVNVQYFLRILDERLEREHSPKMRELKSYIEAENEEVIRVDVSIEDRDILGKQLDPPRCELSVFFAHGVLFYFDDGDSAIRALVKDLYEAR